MDFRTRFHEVADSRKSSVGGSAAWGFSEAVWFFVIPDVFVTYVASKNPKNAIPAAVSAILGAVLGGIALYFLARWFPSAVAGALSHVPLIFPSMSVAVTEGLASEGWIAMVEGASKGIPYKLFAAEAGYRDLSLAAFVGWSVVARSYRIALSAALAAGAGEALRLKLGWSDTAVLRTWSAVWIVTYCLYAYLVIHRYA